MLIVVKPYKVILPYSGGFVSCTDSDPYPPFVGSKVINSGRDLTITYGDNHRDWKDRIRRGSNATTDLTVDGVRMLGYVPAYYSWHSNCVANCQGSPSATNKGSQWVYGNITSTQAFPTTDPVTLDQEAAKNLAKERFMLNALDKQRRFQGGVFLGELSRSIRMMRKPAKNLFESIGRTTANLRKNGMLLPKHKRREFLGNSYLEASYGWRPLVSDIQNGAEALAEYHLKRGQESVYVRGASGPMDELISDVTTLQPLQYGLSAMRFRRRIVNTSTVFAKYYGKLNVAPVNTLFMYERFLGLDLSSFVPTAWELMPYSFLVDYFTNIGNVINAWSFQEAQLNWCSRTVVRSFNRKYHTGSQFEGDSPSPGSCYGRLVASHPEEFTLQRMRIERSANVLGEMSSIPSIRFRLPGTSMKWLNIAALAKVKFSKPFF